MEFFPADPNNRSSVLKQIYQWGVYDEKLRNFAKQVKEDGRYYRYLYVYSFIHVEHRMCICTELHVQLHCALVVTANQSV
jgi:hypothetical protein